MSIEHFGYWENSEQIKTKNYQDLNNLNSWSKQQKLRFSKVMCEINLATNYHNTYCT